MPEQTPYDENERHESFAKRINGRVWELLGKTDRSPHETEELESAAHASLFHWLRAGTGVHHQRGVWLIARVQTVLGNAAEALRYATRCMELTEEHAELMKDFDHAFAYEAAARAHALAGNANEAAKYLRLAEDAGREIEDDEDRKIFMDDFEGGNWYDVR